jgi:hypothetical protein
MPLFVCLKTYKAQARITMPLHISNRGANEDMFAALNNENRAMLDKLTADQNSYNG